MEAAQARRGSLTVVGTGIRLVGHMTLEAVACIRRAEQVLYLVSDPAAAAWIRRLNPRSESLEDCYREDRPRSQAYASMVERILSRVRAGVRLCVAFYGHPGVFVQPSHEAIRIARGEGFAASMRPGVSAEDCLFADLGVDPARHGCQSFEATDFLLRRPALDRASSLILWQVGAICEYGIRRRPGRNRRALQRLRALLLEHYPPEHHVVVYEAAPYPVCDAFVHRVPLSELAAAPLPALATLYVPPVSGQAPRRRAKRFRERRYAAGTVRRSRRSSPEGRRRRALR